MCWCKMQWSLESGRCCCLACVMNSWCWVFAALGGPTETFQAGSQQGEWDGTSEPTHDCWVALFSLVAQHAGQSLHADCGFWCHAASSGENEWSEASALDFSNSESVVESFLWLVLAVQSGKTGVPAGRCEGIKHSDIKKCILLSKAGSPESPGTNVQACLVGLVGRGRKLLSGQRLEVMFDGHVMSHLSKKAREQISDRSRCVEVCGIHHGGRTWRGPLQRANHNSKARALNGVARRIWARLRREMLSCEAQIRGLWSARPTATVMFPFPGLHGRIVAALVTRSWWPSQLPVSARSDLPSARLSCSVLVRFWWQPCQLGWLGSLCWTLAASLWRVTFCASFLAKSLGWPVPCLQAGQEERGVLGCLLSVQAGHSELGWASVILHLQGVSEAFFNWCCHPQRVDPAVDQAMGVCGVH